MDIRFPVVNPDGETVYITEKKLGPQGVELLIEEDGNEWIQNARLGHVVPAQDFTAAL
jgi:hypothetical protein